MSPGHGWFIFPCNFSCPGSRACRTWTIVEYCCDRAEVGHEEAIIGALTQLGQLEGVAGAAAAQMNTLKGQPDLG